MNDKLEKSKRKNPSKGHTISCSSRNKRWKKLMIFPSLLWMSPRLLPGSEFAGCPRGSVFSFCGLFRSFAVLLPFLFSRCSNIHPSRCFFLFTCFLYVVASSDTIEKVRRHRQMKKRPGKSSERTVWFCKGSPNRLYNRILRSIIVVGLHLAHHVVV